MTAGTVVRPSRFDFLTLLRGELIARYAGPEKKGVAGWANDAEKLDRFMNMTAETVNGTKNKVDIDSPSMIAAWRGMGLKRRPTYKGLRALPEL